MVGAYFQSCSQHLSTDGPVTGAADSNTNTESFPEAYTQVSDTFNIQTQCS